jgi:hypothetical protein
MNTITKQDVKHFVKRCRAKQEALSPLQLDLLNQILGLEIED